MHKRPELSNRHVMSKKSLAFEEVNRLVEHYESKNQSSTSLNNGITGEG